MKRSVVSVGLNSLGRVVIGMTLPCGCCEFEEELNDAQAKEFLNMLTVQIELSRRVQRLPVPWIHHGGHA